MSPTFTSLWLMLLCLLPFYCDALSIGDEICLYMPHITHVNSIRTTGNGSNAGLNFIFDLVVDHRFKVRIENVLLQDINTFTFNTSHIRTTWQGYDEANLKSKTQYESARNVYERRNLDHTESTAQKVAPMCSGLSYDAEFEMINGTGGDLLYSTYRDNHVCLIKLGEPMKVTYWSGGTTSSFARLSATYLLKRHQFLFAPDGRLMWRYFPQQPSSSTDPKDKELFNATGLKESKFSFSTQATNPRVSSSTLLANSNCSKLISEFESKLDFTSKSSLALEMPMRFITRYPDADLRGSKRWLFLEGTDTPNNYHTWSSRGSELASMSNVHSPQTNGTELVALSFLAQEGNNPERLSAIFELRYKHSNLLYMYNSMEGRTNYLEVIWAEYPQDIVYWSTCKKIISFYGYLYTMHNYELDSDHILMNGSNWHLLSTSDFPQQPEAVHAEGDEFWFFSSLWNVDVMIADSSNCNRLNLKRKNETMHLFDHFGIKSAWKPQTGYYDLKTKKWIQMDEFKQSSSSSPMLIYILSAVLIILIVVAILLLIFIKFSRVRGNVVYSQSHVSASPIHLGSSGSFLRSPKDGTRNTTMVKSTVNTILSHGSKGGKKSRLSRSGSRKSLKSYKSPKSPITFKPVKSPSKVAPHKKRNHRKSAKKSDGISTFLAPFRPA